MEIYKVLTFLKDNFYTEINNFNNVYSKYWINFLVDVPDNNMIISKGSEESIRDGSGSFFLVGDSKTTYILNYEDFD